MTASTTQSTTPSAEALRRAFVDFRVFLFLIWKHLSLPDPTPRQYEIAHYLQHGPRRKILLAFRGIGKSWICSAFILWCAWRDKEDKNLVVSASKERSDAFSIFVKRLLSEVPWLSHLAPDPRRGDRDSNVAFDFRGCQPAHAPSCKSVGITGQIAGSRASRIVGDDMEVPNNSETASQREKLIARVSELGGAVLTPVPKGVSPDDYPGGVSMLGTYQVEESLYDAYEERGYELRVWPAEVPPDPSKYKGRLAPSIQAMCDAGVAPGTPTDPDRFDVIELAERKVEYGAAGYALQFMLDTSPSDEMRHPLRCQDLIVVDVARDVGPDFVVWAGDSAHTMEHLSRVGLHGDHFQGPMKVSDAFSPWTGKNMYIDPSGRGKDQTSYCVLFMLDGVLYIKDWGAFPGGYDNKTLTSLAMIARDEGVRIVTVEDNFGDGMWTSLFRPVLQKVYKFDKKDAGCALEEEHVSGQKEVRCIETLEPVMAGHRLAIDESLVRRITKAKELSTDHDAALKSGFYQMTRLTKDRGCLKYDDWMDALGGAVRYWTDRVGQDTQKAAATRKEERLEETLLKFMDNFGPRTPGTWHGNL